MGKVVAPNMSDGYGQILPDRYTCPAPWGHFAVTGAAYTRLST